MTKVMQVLLVRHLAAVTVLLPLCALAICFALSLYLHFDVVNRTHCLVYNFFPSVSSAAGKFSPQKFIWRALLALHLAPRFLLGYLTAGYLARQAGLVGVAFVGSLEHYSLHACSFVVFLVASEAHMVLLTALLRRSFRWKLRLLLCNAVCLANAVYLFVRHNTHCEPGVYSLFAIFEICLVLSNMAFHFTSYWDFYDLQLCVGSVSQD
ncbi:post-GPI attachment to proteins factor 2-like [Pollicipes pollicipes]|uniref:post-GPI attachment to proteins factor 2-like n=1 Tax=Pollicipes pollicipes TaxID=41117 RepID=UPI00188595E7|nr:post-GPI attachment to proteins factor 2-like [Pollicipes pollicipes]